MNWGFRVSGRVAAGMLRMLDLIFCRVLLSKEKVCRVPVESSSLKINVLKRVESFSFVRRTPIWLNAHCLRSFRSIIFNVSVPRTPRYPISNHLKT